MPLIPILKSISRTHPRKLQTRSDEIRSSDSSRNATPCTARFLPFDWRKCKVAASIAPPGTWQAMVADGAERSSAGDATAGPGSGSASGTAGAGEGASASGSLWATDREVIGPKTI